MAHWSALGAMIHIHKFSDVPDGTFKQVVVGDDHACALDLDDFATCWGSNESA